ncbi:TPA: hypothetical protein HA363_03975 [Candidatus Woesearchaeota archaeon]|nr:hypothetical protein [Candidatus Woesearchaeota archaeon]
MKTQNSEFIQKTPVPFDLTTLQTEAYRFFGINPKQTLDIAQELYTSGFISYPRTSSQKLPNVNFKKLLEQLSKYDVKAMDLLKTSLKPSEGKKTDPAHPAIYPTGIIPKLKDRQFKVYDLIVKRFLACFAEEAKRETLTITVDIENEKFIARGTRTIKQGWHYYYMPYVQLEEQQMPKVKVNEAFFNKETIKHDKFTQPPKRFTPASIIRELEKKNLGTKATRAQIVDSLYERNYIKHESIEATELGIQTVETLEKFAAEILDEKLTRHFENEMEKIRQKKLTEDKVLKEAEKTLIKVLEKFKKNEKSIGKELSKSHKQHLETSSFIGKCPNCEKGNLKIMYSRKSKRKFIACDAYPECKTIMNMPGYNIKVFDKTCEHCKYPIVRVIAGKNTKELCINNHCPSKKHEDKKVQKHIDALENGQIVSKCPKCNKDLVLRKSVYGQFLGCSGFPKCRYTEKIPENEEDKKAIEKKREYIKNNQNKDQSPPSSKSMSSKS